MKCKCARYLILSWLTVSTAQAVVLDFDQLQIRAERTVSENQIADSILILGDPSHISGPIREYKQKVLSKAVKGLLATWKKRVDGVNLKPLTVEGFPEADPVLNYYSSRYGIRDFSRVGMIVSDKGDEQESGPFDNRIEAFTLTTFSELRQVEGVWNLVPASALRRVLTELGIYEAIVCVYSDSDLKTLNEQATLAHELRHTLQGRVDNLLYANFDLSQDLPDYFLKVVPRQRNVMVPDEDRIRESKWFKNWLSDGTQLFALVVGDDREQSAFESFQQSEAHREWESTLLKEVGRAVLKANQYYFLQFEIEAFAEQARYLQTRDPGRGQVDVLRSIMGLPQTQARRRTSSRPVSSSRDGQDTTSDQFVEAETIRHEGVLRIPEVRRVLDEAFFEEGPEKLAASALDRSNRSMEKIREHAH